MEPGDERWPTKKKEHAKKRTRKVSAICLCIALYKYQIRYTTYCATIGELDLANNPFALLLTTFPLSHSFALKVPSHSLTTPSHSQSSFNTTLTDSQSKLPEICKYLERLQNQKILKDGFISISREEKPSSQRTLYDISGYPVAAPISALESAWLGNQINDHMSVLLTRRLLFTRPIASVNTISWVAISIGFMKGLVIGQVFDYIFIWQLGQHISSLESQSV